MRDSTLDQLWQTLGLDSLPPDAGSAEKLSTTRMPDWEAATIPHEASAAPVTERVDLPRISLAPPPVEHAPVSARELVVTGLLGEGGMGRVLLAQQASLGRDVAVKVPRENASQGTVNALVAEARTTGALEHPGVIPVYSLASDASGQPALVMKRVEGVSWSMLLRNAEDPTWARLLPPGGERLDVHVEILRQVCNAVAFAHQKGVLHRDLKPSNVLLGEYGEVYVADWGIAIRKGTPRKPSLVGSPVYLAPEMCTGDDLRMDERTDVFLLGATLYEVLTGHPPWTGPDLRAVVEAAFDCRPSAPPATAPAELVAICGKAMSPRPVDRYQTALEFREALGGYLQHRGSVHLAKAAEERLLTLLATLQSTAREEVYPLLSECRFGFTQALREWPENDVAKRGLARCLEATAHFEISQGNLAAARALAAELKVVPPELAAALEHLAEWHRENERRQARLEQLSQEMDPRVASRQRVAVFAAVIAAIVAVVIAPRVPVIAVRLAPLGTWSLSVLMAVVVVAFMVAVLLGRRSILSTRLNRRMMGLVGVSGLATLVQRLVGSAMGLSAREIVLQNFLQLTALCLVGGFTLHWGFFWSAGALVAGLAISVLVPGFEAQLYGVASVGALVFAVLSWRGWKGEFSTRKPES